MTRILARTDGVLVAGDDGRPKTVDCADDCCGPPVGDCDCAPQWIHPGSDAAQATHNDRCFGSYPFSVSAAPFCCGVGFTVVAVASVDVTATIVLGLPPGDPEPVELTSTWACDVLYAGEFTIAPGEGEIPLVTRSVSGSAPWLDFSGNDYTVIERPAIDVSIPSSVAAACPRPFTLDGLAAVGLWSTPVFPLYLPVLNAARQFQWAPGPPGFDLATFIPSYFPEAYVCVDVACDDGIDGGPWNLSQTQAVTLDGGEHAMSVTSAGQVADGFGPYNGGPRTVDYAAEASVISIPTGFCDGNVGKAQIDALVAAWRGGPAGTRRLTGALRALRRDMLRRSTARAIQDPAAAGAIERQMRLGGCAGCGE